MIKRWKKETKNILILDAGDTLYPTFGTPPPAANLKAVMNLKAEAIVAAFNQMGTDAMTIGENDLLWGKENLLDVLEDAEFPVVSANLVDSRSGTPLFHPFVVKEMDGLRIGIFGLYPKASKHPDGRLAGLTVLEPLNTARQVLAELKETTDFVILLSHLGYPRDMELAKQIDGIGVIVGGHTGINLSHPRMVRNTMVLQVATKGRYLGKADLRIKDPAGPFVNVETQEMLQRRAQSIEDGLEALQNENPQNPATTVQKRKALEQQKEEIVKVLQSHEGNNELVNRIVALVDDVPADADCENLLKTYRLRIEEAERSLSSGEVAPQ